MGGLHLEEVALIQHFADYFVHVVWLVGRGGDDRV